MSADPHATTDGDERSKRIEQLLHRFRQDSLTVEEARELLGYIRADLRRVRQQGNQKAAHVIQRYEAGVESYIALREGPPYSISVVPGS